MPAPDPNEPLVSSYQDDPDMVDLVREFVGEMPRRLVALEAAWRERQVNQLTRLAHQLKGCCAGYGFPRIGVAAATLEERLRALESPAAEQQLEALKREFAELMDLCARASVK